MDRKRARKELQTVETFEEALREEISISSEFYLPLAVLAAYVEGGWEEGAIRRALDTLRVADLVALPNTTVADARAVEERLRKAVPEAALGVAGCEPGDAIEDLLERARAAASRAAEDPEIP